MRVRQYIPAELERRLRGPASVCRCRHYPVLDSTNDRLKEMAEAGAPEGTVVLADAQSRGRGCGGREFFSPAGTGLYMSVLLRSVRPLTLAPLITVAAAVAVSEAIEEVCAAETRIKWVNDIFRGDKKICGILTESALYHETAEADHVVLGIGVNLYPPPGGFPAELRETAGCLYEGEPGEMGESGRGPLAAGILNRFFVYLADLAGRPFMAEYRRRSNILGQSVVCREGGVSYAARALAIDEDGGLVVGLEDGSRKVLVSGETRIRLAG